MLSLSITAHRAHNGHFNLIHALIQGNVVYYKPSYEEFFFQNSLKVCFVIYSSYSSMILFSSEIFVVLLMWLRHLLVTLLSAIVFKCKIRFHFLSIRQIYLVMLGSLQTDCYNTTTGIWLARETAHLQN